MAKTPPKSILSRSSKLLGMATKVAAKEVGHRLANKLSQKIDEHAPENLKARIEQARLITESLSQLKGAAMKAGQMLSIDASEFLPEEAREILSTLQAEAEPTDFSVIEKMMLQELGPEKFDQIKDLSQKPAASASIGQVHRGWVSGQELAFKVQYPGVKESIDSDLKLLRKVSETFLSLSGRQVDLEETFDEFATVLKWETDYNRERGYMKDYAQRLAGASSYTVPEAIDEFSTEKVLAMSWVEAQRLSDWIKQESSQDAKDQMGHLILDLYCREFGQWGLVQTDPNFANFLVQSDGVHADPLRLVLLDFGATIEYPEDFRRQYHQVVKDLASGDTDRMFQAVVDFGLLQARESRETQEAFAHMLRVSLEPFREDRQPFDFADIDYERRAREAGLAFTRSLQFSAPPRKIIFLHRKLGGIFNLLKRMNICMDLRPYWERMVP